MLALLLETASSKRILTARKRTFQQLRWRKKEEKRLGSGRSWFCLPYQIFYFTLGPNLNIIKPDWTQIWHEEIKKWLEFVYDSIKTMNLYWPISVRHLELGKAGAAKKLVKAIRSSPQLTGSILLLHWMEHFNQEIPTNFSRMTLKIAALINFYTV